MIKTAESYHIPVLLNESIEGLNLQKGGIYVDVTMGGGGHTLEILNRMDKDATLFSFDQDLDAYQNMLESHSDDIAQDERFVFVRSNFRYLKNWMRYHGVEQIDGLLADLGVSSHHFDDENRGFSFRFDSPLDMRMNKSATQTAADVVNNYSEEALADVFYLYGELKNARRIASLLVKQRTQTEIKTTQQLITVLEPLFKREREKKDLAKLFQALRIEVNGEMQALKEMLNSATQLKLINNKVIVPSEEEQEQNPRSRSAKLRIAEKK